MKLNKMAPGVNINQNQSSIMTSVSSKHDDLMPSDEDLLYEEELLRNPYNLKMWWRYIQARSDAPARRRYLLYERSLRALPGSYKVKIFLVCQVFLQRISILGWAALGNTIPSLTIFSLILHCPTSSGMLISGSEGLLCEG
jgi:hypothetical protein